MAELQQQQSSSSSGGGSPNYLGGGGGGQAGQGGQSDAEAGQKFAAEAEQRRGVMSQILTSEARERRMSSPTFTFPSLLFSTGNTPFLYPRKLNNLLMISFLYAQNSGKNSFSSTRESTRNRIVTHANGPRWTTQIPSIGGSIDRSLESGLFSTPVTLVIGEDSY